MPVSVARSGAKESRQAADAPAGPSLQPSAVNPVWCSLATRAPARAPAGAPADPSERTDASQLPDVLRSEAGHPLDGVTRAYFQMRFGRDMGAVRVHTGEGAEASARALDADAYTIGSHVVFGEGRFAPATAPGRRLLAHELTHVVQQGAAPVADEGGAAPVHARPAPVALARRPATAGAASGERLPLSRPDEPAEREADEVAAAITGGGGRIHALPMAVSPPAIQRSPAKDKAPAPPGGVIEGAQGDVTYRLWPAQGLMSLSLGGEPWITVRWAPSGSATPTFTVTKKDSFPAGYGVQVDAAFDLRVTVRRATESAYADRRLGGASFSYSYRGHGHKVSINHHLPGGGIVTTQGDFQEKKAYEGHLTPPRFDIELMPAQPSPRLAEPPPFWWELDTIDQLDRFAAVHPAYYWVAFQPAAGGRLRAVNLTERALQKVADRFRMDPEAAASVLKLYESGKAWPDLEGLLPVLRFPDPGGAGSAGRRAGVHRLHSRQELVRPQGAQPSRGAARVAGSRDDRHHGRRRGGRGADHRRPRYLLRADRHRRERHGLGDRPQLLRAPRHLLRQC